MRNIKTECVLECYYDKELKCCGSCFRTLDEIAEAGKRKKKMENNTPFYGCKFWTESDSALGFLWITHSAIFPNLETAETFAEFKLKNDIYIYSYEIEYYYFYKDLNGLL